VTVTARGDAVAGVRDVASAKNGSFVLATLRVFGQEKMYLFRLHRINRQKDSIQ
jgi:hypothetical protein